MGLGLGLGLALGPALVLVLTLGLQLTLESGLGRKLGLRPQRDLWLLCHEHTCIAWPGCNGPQKNTCTVDSKILRVHIGNYLHHGSQHLRGAANTYMCWTAQFL